MIKRLALLCCLLLLPGLADAANRFVHAGATGNGSGSDWTNAFTALLATLNRGDTYYIADGSYGGYTFDDAVSGTTLITIGSTAMPGHTRHGPHRLQSLSLHRQLQSCHGRHSILISLGAGCQPTSLGHTWSGTRRLDRMCLGRLGIGARGGVDTSMGRGMDS